MLRKDAAWMSLVLFALAGCGSPGAEDAASESSPLVGASQLDTTFGSGGVVTVEGLVANALGVDGALQADGKIVIGTAAPDNALGTKMAVLRLLANGAVDGTFGTAGIATVPFPAGSTGSATSVAIQTDGKILAASGVLQTPSGLLDAFSVARFNSNGSVDTTFGVQGVATATLPGSFGGAAVVLVQPDKKILLAGSSKATTPVRAPRTSALVRFNANGTLDTTFGSAGIVISSAFGPVTAAALEPDGSILVTSNQAAVPNVAARFSSTGASLPLALTGTLAPIKAQGNVTFSSDGHVVSGGTVHGLGKDGTFEQVVELTINGGVVFAGPSFDWGTPGVFNAEDVVQAIAVEPTGEFVAGGISLVCPTSQVCLVAQTSRAFGLAVLLPKATPPGSLDPSFGAGGIVQTQPGQKGQVLGLLLQPDRKIIAVGLVTGAITPTAIALARYRAP